MIAAMESSSLPRGRRLGPEERRREIIAAARSLFAHREPSALSTADVARAAGVTPALVRHYFEGGVAEIHAAVAAELGRDLAVVRTAGTEVSVDRRIEHNLRAFLDVVQQHPETWLATTARGGAETERTREAMIEINVDRMLQANADLLRDTPFTRFALRSFTGMVSAACHQWLTAGATRDDVEQVLLPTFVHLISSTLRAGDR